MRRLLLVCACIGCAVGPVSGQERMANGLWMGAVTASAVSVPAFGSEGPQPAPAPFSFPVILYVDDAGAQLVDEAVILRSVKNAPGPVPIALPKLYLDMDALRADLSAIGTENIADIAARRLASAAYSLGGKPVRADGDASPGETLTLTLTLAPEMPTHPLRHQYHPDHDNLSADHTPLGEGDVPEVPAIRRELALTLERVEGAAVSGRFAETIHGLHAVPLEVAGRFSVDLVSAMEVRP